MSLRGAGCQSRLCRHPLPLPPRPSARAPPLPPQRYREIRKTHHYEYTGACKRGSPSIWAAWHCPLPSIVLSKKNRQVIICIPLLPFVSSCCPLYPPAALCILLLPPHPPPPPATCPTPAAQMKTRRRFRRARQTCAPLGALSLPPRRCGGGWAGWQATQSGCERRGLTISRVWGGASVGARRAPFGYSCRCCTRAARHPPTPPPCDCRAGSWGCCDGWG